MQSDNNTTTLNNSTSTSTDTTAATSKPAKANKANKGADNKRHVFGTLSVFSMNGALYVDLSAFGLTPTYKIGGKNGDGSEVILTTSGGTVARTLVPKTDRTNKSINVGADFDEPTLNGELEQAIGVAVAAALYTAPKAHAKPAGCKGNTRKDRVIAVRTQQIGRALRGA